MSVPPAPGSADAIELSAAYVELQNLLLEGSEITSFLDQVATLAAAVVPASACGITMRRDGDVFTAASSGQLARDVDEIQYGRGQGPCLETLRTGRITTVEELVHDDRWPGYREHALERGVISSLSLPLTVDGVTIGALNLYGAAVGQFGEASRRRAQAFAAQGATALTIVMRQGHQACLEQQLRDALASRAVIDQAIGMIAGLKHISAREAFAELRSASQHRNLKLSAVAEETIMAISGHPYQPPRPFNER